jgi:seryl-tRNA synthetase
MLDLKLIRDNPGVVKEALVKLNATAPIDEIIEFDERRRALLSKVEALKAERNEGSKTVSKTKNPDERNRLIVKMRELGDEIAVLDDQAREIDAELLNLQLLVPNLPLPEVPVGPDDSFNVVTREVGKPREFGFTPKPHWEIGEQLGIIDFERGVKVGGAR